MFSAKFLNITEQIPSNAKALRLVEKYLEDAASQQRLGKLRLEPRFIQKISQIDSSHELAVLISLLLSEHILRRVIVVESPAGGGVAEFASIDEVPERLHDHHRDIWMDVTPDVLRTYYVAESP
ncbi:hypothetical protein [Acidovorax sp. Root568]|uniref:hypothetical protein n=1 Tax=Acidovorax sp. Root568 TaxID=1736565 RepID=UPI0012E393D4|nr:hypothetical protein [Acidovorax sp. Root568]